MGIQSYTQEWFYEKCSEITKKNNKARKKMLQRETRSNHEKYKLIKIESDQNVQSKTGDDGQF